MKQAIVPFIWCLGLVMIVGCTGTGEVIPIHLRTSQAAAERAAAPPSPLRMAIGAFEDGRQHQTGLGVRSHLWGGVSYFDVPGGNLADAVAQALAEYLKANGWRVVKEGSGEGADVAITGKIQALSVRAKSRIGFTAITTASKLTIQATNRADGSVVHMTLNGSGSEDVFWFGQDDVQDVLNEVLTDSFGKLMEDTTVVNRVLRLKER